MKKYSKEQIDFIIKNAPGISLEELSQRFNAKFSEMEMTAGKMKCLLNNRKIKTGYKRKSKYSDEQLEFLKQFVPGIQTKKQ